MSREAQHGPTDEYGTCEADHCDADARSTCRKCGGHFCYGHAKHAQHPTTEQ